MSRLRRHPILAILLGAAALATVAAAVMLARGHFVPRSGGTTMPSPPASRQARALYRCPMHPTMTSDHPGDCPICSMRMVPIDAAEPAATPSPTVSPRVIYRSTMNPGEISDHPGKDSMGMEMVPVEVGAPSAQAPEVEGLAGFQVPTRKQQLIGIRTSLVERARFLRTLRTVGRVVVDETRITHVHTKTDGWVESLTVNSTGERVRKGQRLLSLYSPELLATQEEHLLALRAQRSLAEGPLPDAARRAADLVQASRRRLLLYDLTPAQIDALEATGQPSRNVELYSPVSGYVLQRNVTQGERITPDTNLLDIADLSRVWVMVSVFEYELPFVRLGQPATMTLSYLPGRLFKGKVAYIYPVLEGATRSVQVRLEFPNPSLELKPEMYVEVNLQGDLGERLSIPSTAILATGIRNVVFVDQGNGYFEPREVHLGLRLPDRTEVLDGVAEGDRVVTSGNFFIDSESKLKSALESVAAPSPTPAREPDPR
jgi:membrane fusion protein, copper/silver efflux system